jgi:hypothetical protein
MASKRFEMSVSPEAFVKDQIPYSSWPAFPTILKTAYKAVEDIVANNAMLNVASAQDNKGRLLTWAVDLGIERAIKQGTIDCDYRWKPFARPTGRFLEMRFSHSIATISQVKNPRVQPRNVVFRQNAKISNTGSLFEGMEGFEDEISGLPHILLVHGHQSLDFSYLGIPSAYSKTKYEWLSNNLMNMPHEIASELPPSEDTDSSLDGLELLKEDIARWERDKDG